LFLRKLINCPLLIYCFVLPKYHPITSQILWPWRNV